MNFKFHMQHDQTAGPQTCKGQPGRESKMAADTKIAKSLTFFQNGMVYLAEILYVLLMGPK